MGKVNPFDMDLKICQTLTLSLNFVWLFKV